MSAKTLKRIPLPSMTGFPLGTNVSQPEDRGAVGDDGDQVALAV